MLFCVRLLYLDIIRFFIHVSCCALFSLLFFNVCLLFVSFMLCLMFFMVFTVFKVFYLFLFFNIFFIFLLCFLSCF